MSRVRLAVIAAVATVLIASCSRNSPSALSVSVSGVDPPQLSLVAAGVERPLELALARAPTDTCRGRSGGANRNRIRDAADLIGNDGFYGSRTTSRRSEATPAGRSPAPPSGRLWSDL